MTEEKYLELEVKFHVRSHPEIEKRLNQCGAKLITPRVYEYNIRYEDKNQSLTSQGIVVRLRQDNNTHLTYKEPTEQHHPDITTRFEAEVEISDFDTMKIILRRLGFIPFLIYEKYRTTYHLDDTEVVLDEMPYGTFVEIEGTAQHIEQVVTKLGLENQPRIMTNYLQIFDRVRERLQLDFTDITFDNFKERTIPEWAFSPVKEQ